MSIATATRPATTQIANPTVPVSPLAEPDAVRGRRFSIRHLRDATEQPWALRDASRPHYIGRFASQQRAIASVDFRLEQEEDEVYRSAAEGRRS